MTVFKNAVNAYVTSGQTEIHRRQEKHKNVIRRELEKVAKMNAEIEEFRVNEMNLMKTLKREQEEKAEAEAKLAEYEAQLKDVDENRAAVDAELEDLRSRTDRLKLEKSQDMAKLEYQVGLNEPEAHALSDLLKWSVESVQRDVVCITFTHIDESDWAREFSFVLDLSDQAYKVTTSRPLLPQMSGLVEWLNETGEFYWFVKKVRMGFEQYVRDERRARQTKGVATVAVVSKKMSVATTQVSKMDSSSSSTLPKPTRKATSPAQPLQPPFPHQPTGGYPYPTNVNPNGNPQGYYYPQPGYPQGYFAQTPDQQQQQQFAQWAFQQMMFNSQQQAMGGMPGVPEFAQRTRTGSGAGQEFGMGFQSGTPPPPPMHYGSVGRAAGTDHQGFHPYRRPGGPMVPHPHPHPHSHPHPHPHPHSHSLSQRSTNQEFGFQPYMHPGYPQPPRPYAREMNGSATSLHSNSSSSRQRTGSNPRPPNANGNGNSQSPRHGRNQSVGSSISTSARPESDRSVTPPARQANASPVSASSPTVPRPVKPSPLSQQTFADKRMSRDDSTLEAPHAALPKTNGLKGRLRRALSFSAIQTLDEAEDGKEKLGSRRKAIEKANKANAALQKQQQQQDHAESPGAAESIRTTASKKPSRGLFNRRLNASTDNISLQSTVSSASVMIRKLGSMGNIARRNSLAGLTGLFKDKKDKRHKAEASEASVTHATVEVDRLPGPSPVGAGVMDDMTGLSPAAKLARQHTLKSNAQAAERAKQEAQAAATAAAVAEANRVEEEDEEEEEEEEPFDPAAHMTGGFDDEDITVRLEQTRITDDQDEVWAVGIRRSVERTRKPVKGILRNAVNFNQEIYLDKENATSLRQRSNSETNPSSQPGPLARIPSPDPHHIDGLHRSNSPHDTVKSTFSADFGEFTTPSLSLAEKADRGGPFTYTHPALNSSAPVLSTISNNPGMAQRSATAPGRRRLTFANNLSVYDTFAPSTYDRRSEPATCNRLTPALAQRIKEELNSYKMEEMEVHASSRIHTHFFA
ncbi:Nuclear anchorage protein 1 [Rhizoctonia solani]|uniref:Nuclear anchorage protein 1 n=1 Tax=Rhizoctonia solani TaxID=456999 RepID=A0A0K6FZH6_9AGAM|nr:Nuclear anchorage protein 1 [Rhizoctonia solani]